MGFSFNDRFIIVTSVYDSSESQDLFIACQAPIPLGLVIFAGNNHCTHPTKIPFDLHSIPTAVPFFFFRVAGRLCTFFFPSFSFCSSISQTLDAAMDTYQSVPLDEEQQTSEKETLLLQLEKPVPFYKSLVQRSGLQPHLIWILHGLLLSTSLSLFALSFCLHFGRPSVLSCTGQISPYCKSRMFMKDVSF